ncbi:hypothetical protein N8A98_20445 [Devosia neptuniae]|uniref:DUF883 domain-containing protein n=1 Tax=Devosia neptuniae TaxID=191302 RepID=A0ABY6CEZ5_9HYPH|nr:hypothetical protein [Devosia neptuniae]UXN69566.1 hypothetical protein N8A98_20445 [Devosia neptuniae]
MATSARRAIKQIEEAGDDISDNLVRQIAALRKEIAGIADAVSDYSDHGLHDVQHNALALANEVRHQGAAVAKQVSRQAGVASRAARDHPVPLIIALGTIALLSALVFRRD